MPGPALHIAHTPYRPSRLLAPLVPARLMLLPPMTTHRGFDTPKRSRSQPPELRFAASRRPLPGSWTRFLEAAVRPSCAARRGAPSLDDPPWGQQSLPEGRRFRACERHTLQRLPNQRHGLPLRPDSQTQPGMAALWERQARRYRHFDHLEPRLDVSDGDHAGPDHSGSLCLDINPPPSAGARRWVSFPGIRQLVADRSPGPSVSGPISPSTGPTGPGTGVVRGRGCWWRRYRSPAVPPPPYALRRRPCGFNLSTLEAHRP